MLCNVITGKLWRFHNICQLLRQGVLYIHIYVVMVTIQSELENEVLTYSELVSEVFTLSELVNEVSTHYLCCQRERATDLGMSWYSMLISCALKVMSY